MLNIDTIEENIFEPSNMFNSMITAPAGISKAEGHKIKNYIIT